MVNSLIKLAAVMRPTIPTNKPQNAFVVVAMETQQPQEEHKCAKNSNALCNS